MMQVSDGQDEEPTRSIVTPNEASRKFPERELGRSSDSQYDHWSAEPGAMTVLVVDDEVHIVDFLTVLLEEEGCTVFRAFNGLQAWEVSERCHPDLVISDVMMPGLTGVELARRIKAAHNGSSPRIVLMSAVRETAAEPGVDFLRKPFDIEHILDIVWDCGVHGRST